MKKRILSYLMALALCLTLLPTAALAADPHTHCLCGAEHNSEIKTHKEDTKIHFETMLYSESGNYQWFTKEKGASLATNLEYDTKNKQWVLPAGNYYLDDGSAASVFCTECTIRISGNVTISVCHLESFLSVWRQLHIDAVWLGKAAPTPLNQTSVLQLGKGVFHCHGASVQRGGNLLYGKHKVNPAALVQPAVCL